MLRFALFTALALAVAGAAILFFVRHFNTSQAERAATLQAKFVADSLLRAELERDDFRGPVVGTRRAELDRLFAKALLVDGAVLVKLFALDGTVTYSNSHALIGTVAPSREQLGEALEGTILSDVTSLAAEGGSSDLKVLKAYVPVSPEGSRFQGVAAIYQDYAPIAAAASRAFVPVAGVLEVVLLVLYVALIPVLRRVSRRLRSQMDRIEYTAYHDDLTELPNRKLFRGRVEQELLLAERGDYYLTVMLIDLDRFKEINDTLGHESGDRLLGELGARLRAVHADAAMIARLGGDEFGVVIPRASAQDASGIARRLLSAIAEPFELQGIPLVVTGSIGIAVAPDDGVDVETLISHADVAMYLAKERRSGYAFYDAEYDPNDAGRLALATDLRRGLDRGEIVLHFQPQVNLGTGRIAGAEVLARWLHPERGLLRPSEFLPLAEQTGLVKRMTRYVLEQVLRQLRTWSDMGLDTRLAVNLSTHDLLDLSLGDEIAQLLGKWQVAPERLELEITENAIMTDPFRVPQILTTLNAMGIRLAIDDFGTGYSSLSRLKRLPVDILKIDRSFVMNMLDDPNDATIVRSTVELGLNLGLEVVAEGVETEAMLGILSQLGCQYAQGYYVGAPVSAAEFEALLSSGESDVRGRRSALRAIA